MKYSISLVSIDLSYSSIQDPELTLIHSARESVSLQSLDITGVQGYWQQIDKVKKVLNIKMSKRVLSDMASIHDSGVNTLK